MSKNNLERTNVLVELIREIGAVDEDDLDFSVTVDLFDYGYLDSFGIVELITLAQEKFGTDLSDTDFYGGDVRTIEKISSHIGELLSQENADG